MLREMLERRFEYARKDGDRFFDAVQNARLIANAERYYRSMFSGRASSWNLRDTHMFETLCQLLDAKGMHSKAVVWAHNSHIGNAAYTEMGQVREELNLGFTDPTNANPGNVTIKAAPGVEAQIAHVRRPSASEPAEHERRSPTSASPTNPRS